MTERPTPDTILQEALEITDPAARTAYLDEACEGDEVLRAEIESLLTAHFAADTFMDNSADPAWQETPTEQEGDRIGRYKLLQRIGEGGGGVVWMADQIEPVKRRVAFKIIKLGMDTRQVVARFEAERQTLALMNHPNIAKVLDAGSTSSGRPYFVMELVRGVPITRFCDDHKLSTRERLELFIQVCRAVQHAHQKGIIHRDLKPGNILVTIQEDRPQPKVIDFGIAKAIQKEITDKALVTHRAHFIGTPAYMSPEQASMTGCDIDTRSDIYALGVVLYEVLTGKTPFDTTRFLKVGYDEIRRVIVEDEPSKPSTRLGSLGHGERAELAGRRQVDPHKLSRLVRGDLDWIVMKAIEKDRRRRYETANGLAMDVQRHLNREPVTASPPTVWYLLTKYASRHRGPLIAGLAVASVLLAGIVISSTQAVRAREAERLAGTRLSQVERQEQEAHQAKEAAVKLYTDLKQAVDRSRKSDQGRKDAEASAATEKERVESILAFLRSQEIRRELQRRDPDGLKIIQSIDQKIGQLFEGGERSFAEADFSLSKELGEAALESLELDLDSASSSFGKALTLLASLEPHGSDPAAERNCEKARLLTQLATIKRLTGAHAASLAYLDQVREVLPTPPHAGGTGGPAGDSGRSAVLAWADLERALLWEQAGRDPEAHAAAKSAFDQFQPLVAGESGGQDANRVGKLRSAALLARTGDPNGNAPEHEQRLRIAASDLETNRGQATPGPGTELALLEAGLALSELYVDRQQWQEANEVRLATLPVAAAVERAAALAAAQPNDRRLKLFLVGGYFLLGKIHRGLGSPYEALQWYEKCRDGAAAIMRRDEDLAAPLETVIRTSYEVAGIYGEADEYGKQLEALQACYDGVVEARKRGLDGKRPADELERLPHALVEATIRRFFVVSGTRGTLEENAFYADVVDYLNDGMVGRQRIISEQNAYRERYPMRFYEVVKLEGLTGNETLGFQVTAHVHSWIGVSKTGTITVAKPDSSGTYEFGLAFDETHRLRIERLRYVVE